MTMIRKRILHSRHQRLWSQPVQGPPLSEPGCVGNGMLEPEALLITGEFFCESEEWLHSHQIDLSFASYNPRTGCFERCLVSEENHTILRELQLQGQFETRFYLTYSLGEVYYREQLQAGALQDGKRPSLPQWAYVMHPTPEARQNLEGWVSAHTVRLKVLKGGQGNGD